MVENPGAYTQSSAALLLSRIRRNHGLEHATLNVLAQRFPDTPLAGHSDFNGFWILGNVPPDDLSAAVLEALTRLQKGEARLAIHPGCGTNYATTGILAGTAAALAMFGAGRRARDWLERLPFAAMLATLAVIAAQPLGLAVQARLTTSGIPGALQVVQITRNQKGRVSAYRVITEG